MAPKTSTTSNSGPKRRSSTSSSLTSTKPSSTTSKTLQKFNSLTGAFSSAKSGNLPASKKQQSKSQQQPAPAQIELDSGSEEEQELDPRQFAGLLKESKKKMGKPIHAEDWDDYILILRVFDAELEYGPVSNLSRLERYERAVSLGLNPPREIGQILTSKVGRSKTEYAQSPFNSV